MCLLKQSIPPFEQKPFHFVETGINVYSFEELLFHCYHHWKESVNDFLEGRITAWVKDTLKLNFLGGQIEKIINTDEMLSERLLKFLALEGYFDKTDLDLLEFEVMTWENKSELEKLKQQGDERLSAADYEKALFYYSKLLTYGESASIHNNIGCCHMKLGAYTEAEKHFESALGLEPRNYRVKLNKATLYLLQNRSLAAEELLIELEKTDNGSEVQYYLGNFQMEKGDLDKAYGYFKNSAHMGNEADANAALCRLEMKRKDYAAADAFLEKMPNKNTGQYLYLKAQVCYQAEDMDRALRFAEKLVANDSETAGYWAFAAKLYRESGYIEKAQKAVERALEIDQTNDQAVFENARIKKVTGKPLEYQLLIKQITEKWRSRYKAAN